MLIIQLNKQIMMQEQQTLSKYFAIADYNKFTNENLDLKIKQKELVDKSDIAGFINIDDLDKDVATLATKAELKAEKDQITKL